MENPVSLAHTNMNFTFILWKKKKNTVCQTKGVSFHMGGQQIGHADNNGLMVYIQILLFRNQEIVSLN